MMYNPELVKQELAKEESLQKSSSWKHIESKKRLILVSLQKSQ